MIPVVDSVSRRTAASSPPTPRPVLVPRETSSISPFHAPLSVVFGDRRTEMLSVLPNFARDETFPSAVLCFEAALLFLLLRRLALHSRGVGQLGSIETIRFNRRSIETIGFNRFNRIHT